MKKLLFTAAVSSACALSAAAPAAAFDFDGSTGTGTVLKGRGKIQYVPGVAGQALKMGDNTLSIPCPANVNPHEGSLSLWVKPVNWDQNKEEFVTFLFNLNPKKNGRLMLYKYRKSTGLGLVFWFGDPDSKNRIILSNPKAVFKQDQWMHLAVTWSKKTLAVKCFINGKKVRETKCEPELFYDTFGSFVLNEVPFRPNDRTLESAYDQLRLYPAPLSEDEVAKIYADHAKTIGK